MSTSLLPGYAIAVGGGPKKASLAWSSIKSRGPISRRRPALVLDSQDDPAIVFAELNPRPTIGQQPPSLSGEADELLWACHRAWDF